MNCTFCVKENKYNTLVDMGDSFTCNLCCRVSNEYISFGKIESIPLKNSNFSDSNFHSYRFCPDINEACARFCFGKEIQIEAVRLYNYLKSETDNSCYSNNVFQMYALYVTANDRRFSFDVESLCGFFSISKTLFFKFQKYLGSNNVYYVKPLSLESQCYNMLTMLNVCRFDTISCLTSKILSLYKQSDSNLNIVCVCVFTKFQIENNSDCVFLAEIQKNCSLMNISKMHAVKCYNKFF